MLTFTLLKKVLNTEGGYKNNNDSIYEIRRF